VCENKIRLMETSLARACSTREKRGTNFIKR
jgi:hypothetical protein